MRFNWEMFERIMQAESKGGHGINYSKIYPVIKKIKGDYLIDIYGNSYLDLFSGCSSTPWGNNKKLNKALKNQSKKLFGYYDTYHEERLLLTENILKYVGDFKIMYTVIGSQATSMAMRLALYNRLKKFGRDFKREVYITKTSYHGSAETTNRLTNKSSSKIFYPPFKIKYLDSLKDISKIPSGGILMFEPYESANSGNEMKSQEELFDLIHYCKNRDILLIWDEVQTGGGRTGEMFVFKSIPHYIPQIVVIGKNLANGLPLSAVLFDSFQVKDWEGRAYNSTFSANPLACAVANEVFDLLFKEKYLLKIKEKGKLFKSILNKELNKPCFKGYEVQFKGLYGRIKLPISLYDKSIVKKAAKEGVILRFANDSLLLTPQFTISTKNMKLFTSILINKILKKC